MAVLFLLLVLAFDDNVPVPAAPEPEAAAAAVKGRFATFNDANRDRSTSIAALSSGVGGIAVDEFAINSMIVSTLSISIVVSVVGRRRRRGGRAAGGPFGNRKLPWRNGAKKVARNKWREENWCEIEETVRRYFVLVTLVDTSSLITNDCNTHRHRHR